VYIFVSNENETQVDIHFDDLKITHTPTNVVQYNEYYPYGLPTASSWTRENKVGNNYLYNGPTETNPTTGWGETPFRTYDPVLARFHQVDPLAAKYASLSPYNYAFNNPVSLNDPTGADPYIDALTAGIIVSNGGSLGRAEQRWHRQVMDPGNNPGSSIGNTLTITVDWNLIPENFDFRLNLNEEDWYVTLAKYDFFYREGNKFYYNKSFETYYFSQALTSLNNGTGGGVSLRNSGSDWTSVAQGSLATGELFRNLKAYQFAGTNARKFTNVFDEGMFLHNGRSYTNGYFGNQHSGHGPATIKHVKTTFQNGAKVIKGAGKAIGGFNVVVTGYQVVGDISNQNYYSAGTRVAVAGLAAGAAFIPVVGWGIAIGIGVADAIWGDQFYSYVENKLGG
jgi:RHS repeat-associated protein